MRSFTMWIYWDVSHSGTYIGTGEARCWLLTILLLFVCFLSQQAHGQSADSTHTVHGVVINSVTHEPVARALVFSPDNRFAAWTDDQGHFEFAVPPPAAPTPEENATHESVGANYVRVSFSTLPSQLMARKPGYLGLERNQSRWEQRPIVQGKDLIIPLVPEARIVGRVVLPTSNASDRITVQLYRRQVMQGRAHWNFVADAATRSNGEFRFADVEPGTYKLLTGELMDRDPLTFDPRGPVYGYPPVYFPDALNFQSAAEIPLSAGMTFQAELSPVRQPYHNVKIPVTNPPDNDDLLVSVAIQGRKGPGFDLGYNRRDQRIEGSLPNGTYVVEASNQGEASVTGSATITVKDAPLEAPPLTMTPTGSVHIETKMDFNPEEGAAGRDQNVSEYVHIENGRRLGIGQNFSVTLDPADEFMHPEMPNGPSSAVQHDESMVFNHVPPGRYWVKLEPARGYAASVTAGEVDLLRRPLTVASGSNLRVDVTLRNDGAEISGSVEGGSHPASGNLLAGNRVEILAADQTPGFIYCIPLPDSTGQFRQNVVEPDGRFDLHQVPPGAYRILAFDRPQFDLEYTNSEAMRAYDGKGQVVRLSAGQKEQLTLPLISTSE